MLNQWIIKSAGETETCLLYNRAQMNGCIDEKVECDEW